ncbi:MAG TPA: ThiF family adenylyltransferase [Verrucomicrobiota bacterium]|nr:ThiF family adenylyltransferase [Verrucomicrobiota bacterium]HQL78165.1 ThiF family adenylyltransferase [Verrucomicrobiota bacterium]
MSSQVPRSAVGHARGALPVAPPPFPLGMPLVGCAAGALGSLAKRRVAVIGCGSVGGRVAILLSRMGIGGLVLVDPKRLKAGGVATHDMGPEDVGKPKALVAARRCRRINPALQVLAFVQGVEALELSVLAGVDLVVMAPDLLAVEVEVGQRCIWLSKPLVHASVHGPTLTAQVRFFLNAREGGGCPACGYGKAEQDLMTRQVRFSCEGAAGAVVPLPDTVPATNSVSPLCAQVAALAVMQAIRFLVPVGQPVADTMLEYCGFTHRTVVSPIARNPDCMLDHSALAQVVLDPPLEELSLAQVAQRATGAPPSADARFELEGLQWVELASCGCDQPRPVRRFVARGRERHLCCRKCSAPLVPLSFYTYPQVSTSVLGSAAERPLRDLGARGLTGLLLRTADTGVLIRQSASPQTLI